MTHLRRYLEEHGVLYPEQLGEAIRRQQIYGGSLDTVLLELELVDPVTLGEMLERACGFPIAPPDLLDNGLNRPWTEIPEDMQRSRWVEPLVRDGDEIVVAVHPDLPNDLLGRLLRSLRRMRPMVTPECCLEKVAAERHRSVVPQRYAVLCAAYLSAVRRRPSMSGVFDVTEDEAPTAKRPVPSPLPAAAGEPPASSSPPPRTITEKAVPTVAAPPVRTVTEPALPFSKTEPALPLITLDAPPVRLVTEPALPAVALDEPVRTMTEPALPAVSVPKPVRTMTEPALPVVPVETPARPAATPAATPVVLDKPAFVPPPVRFPPGQVHSRNVASVASVASDSGSDLPIDRRSAAGSIDVSDPAPMSLPGSDSPRSGTPAAPKVTPHGTLVVDTPSAGSGVARRSKLASTPAAPPPVVPSERDEADVDRRLEQARAVLSDARTRDDALDAIVSAALVLSPRVGLFRARGDELVGLSTPRAALDDLGGKVVATTEGSAAGIAATTGAYSGLAPEADLRLATGITATTPCLLQRVDVRGKPVVYVYMDRDGAPIGAHDVERFGDLAALAGRVFEEILKQRRQPAPAPPPPTTAPERVGRSPDAGWGPTPPRVRSVYGDRGGDEPIEPPHVEPPPSRVSTPALEHPDGRVPPPSLVPPPIPAPEPASWRLTPELAARALEQRGKLEVDLDEPEPEPAEPPEQPEPAEPAEPTPTPEPPEQPAPPEEVPEPEPQPVAPEPPGPEVPEPEPEPAQPDWPSEPSVPEPQPELPQMPDAPEVPQLQTRGESDDAPTGEPEPADAFESATTGDYEPAGSDTGDTDDFLSRFSDDDDLEAPPIPTPDSPSLEALALTNTPPDGPELGTPEIPEPPSRPEVPEPPSRPELPEPTTPPETPEPPSGPELPETPAEPSIPDTPPGFSAPSSDRSGDAWALDSDAPTVVGLPSEDVTQLGMRTDEVGHDDDTVVGLPPPPGDDDPSQRPTVELPVMRDSEVPRSLTRDTQELVSGVSRDAPERLERPRSLSKITMHSAPPPPPLPPPPSSGFDEDGEPTSGSYRRTRSSTIHGLPPPELNSRAGATKRIGPPSDELVLRASDDEEVAIISLAQPIMPATARGRIELEDEDWVAPGSQLASDSQQGLVDAVIDAVVAGEADVETLREHGDHALIRLVAQFPGPLEVLRRDLRALPPPSAHGPLVRTVIAVGAPVVPHLIDLFEHPNPDIRFYAAFVFHELRDSRCMRPLAKLAFDANGDVRVVSMRVLETYRRSEGFEIAAAIVRAQLESDSRAQQLHAARAGGTLRDIGAIPQMIELLSSSDRFIQEAALESLCSITGQQHGLKPHRWRAWYEEQGHRHRVEWIIDSLRHRDLPVRRWAADELVRITGHRVPFSPMGDKRAREVAAKAWTDWWEAKGRSMFGG